MESNRKSSSGKKKSSSNSTRRRSSGGGSKNGTRRVSSDSTARNTAYIALVNGFIATLKGSEKLPKQLLRLITKAGKTYFGKHKYAGIEDVDEMDGQFVALNKAQMLQKMEEEQGEAPEEEFSNDASIEDAYRHSLIIDISNARNPVLVERPDLLNLAGDYILTWTEVQQLPKKLGPKQILVHTENGGEIVWFPIPTV